MATQLSCHLSSGGNPEAPDLAEVMLKDKAQTLFKSGYEFLRLINCKKRRALVIFDLEHNCPLGSFDELPFLSSSLGDDMKPATFVIDSRLYPEVKRVYHSTSPYSALCRLELPPSDWTGGGLLRPDDLAR
jgi:hypothetical protein